MTLYRVTEGERELFVVAPDIDTARIRTAHEWGYPEDVAETSAQIEAIGTVTEIEAALREVRHLRAKLAAYTDLPPEPDTAMGAFMAVLEVDNDPETPDNYAGDCDGET